MFACAHANQSGLHYALVEVFEQWPEAHSIMLYVLAVCRSLVRSAQDLAPDCFNWGAKHNVPTTYSPVNLYVGETFPKPIYQPGAAALHTCWAGSQQDRQLNNTSTQQPDAPEVAKRLANLQARISSHRPAQQSGTPADQSCTFPDA